MKAIAVGVKQDETVGLRTSALRKDGRRTVSLSSTQSSAGKNQLTRLVSLSLGGEFRPANLSSHQSTDSRPFISKTPQRYLHPL